MHCAARNRHPGEQGGASLFAHHAAAREKTCRRFGKYEMGEVLSTARPYCIASRTVVSQPSSSMPIEKSLQRSPPKKIRRAAVTPSLLSAPPRPFSELGTSSGTGEPLQEPNGDPPRLWPLVVHPVWTTPPPTPQGRGRPLSRFGSCPHSILTRAPRLAPMRERRPQTRRGKCRTRNLKGGL